MKNILVYSVLTLAILLACPIPGVMADTAATITTTAPATVTVPATTSVVIPFGDWIDAVANFLLPIISVVVTAMVAWALRFLPATLRTYITSGMIGQVEQLLSNGINYAITTVDGAEHGKTLSVNVVNSVVAAAVQFVVDHGPTYLIQWMGGKTGITQKIVARLPATDAAVSSSTLPPAASAPIVK